MSEREKERKIKDKKEGKPQRYSEINTNCRIYDKLNSDRELDLKKYKRKERKRRRKRERQKDKYRDTMRERQRHIEKTNIKFSPSLRKYLFAVLKFAEQTDGTKLSEIIKIRSERGIIEEGEGDNKKQKERRTDYIAYNNFKKKVPRMRERDMLKRREKI